MAFDDIDPSNVLHMVGRPLICVQQARCGVSLKIEVSIVIPPSVRSARR